MSCLHYKFKSSLDYDTITFDGIHISLGDLKKAIIAQKKLGKITDFEIQVTNAQTKEGKLYFQTFKFSDRKNVGLVPVTGRFITSKPFISYGKCTTKNKSQGGQHFNMVHKSGVSWKR